jgi:hypothetical protein
MDVCMVQNYIEYYFLDATYMYHCYSLLPPPPRPPGDMQQGKNNRWTVRPSSEEQYLLWKEHGVIC